VDLLSLAELSERAQVAPRTIRFYIAQGLLPGPLRSGRGAAYGDVHLELLGRIQALQQQGMTLKEVQFALAPGEGRMELPEPVSWVDYSLAEDVVVRVRVRGGIAPWRHKLIRKVLAEAMAKLRSETEEKETE
jgi:DNA-binding transcriptional MerR regulator